MYYCDRDVKTKQAFVGVFLPREPNIDACQAAPACSLQPPASGAPSEQSTIQSAAMETGPPPSSTCCQRIIHDKLPILCHLTRLSHLLFVYGRANVYRLPDQARGHSLRNVVCSTRTVLYCTLAAGQPSNKPTHHSLAPLHTARVTDPLSWSVGLCPAGLRTYCTVHSS